MLCAPLDRSRRRGGGDHGHDRADRGGVSNPGPNRIAAARLNEAASGHPDRHPLRIPSEWADDRRIGVGQEYESLPGDGRDRLHRRAVWPLCCSTAAIPCAPWRETPPNCDDAPWRDRVEVARGDLGDLDSLTAAFEGIDVVYYLVHSMGTSSDFVAEEAQSAHNVVTAAKQAGVRRIVYLSGLHPDGEAVPHLRRAPRSATSSSTPASRPWCCRQASSSGRVRRRSR